VFPLSRASSTYVVLSPCERDARCPALGRRAPAQTPAMIETMMLDEAFLGSRGQSHHNSCLTWAKSHTAKGSIPGED